eukprot:365930-Chlamydomonas_euryale.AAC.29
MIAAWPGGAIKRTVRSPQRCGHLRRDRAGMLSISGRRGATAADHRSAARVHQLLRWRAPSAARPGVHPEGWEAGAEVGGGEDVPWATRPGELEALTRPPAGTVAALCRGVESARPGSSPHLVSQACVRKYWCRRQTKTTPLRAAVDLVAAAATLQLYGGAHRIRSVTART